MLVILLTSDAILRHRTKTKTMLICYTYYSFTHDIHIYNDIMYYISMLYIASVCHIIKCTYLNA